MKIVGGRSVTSDFRENMRATPESVLQIFQRENRRTFPENHSSAMPIKWSTFLWRRCLKRIEPDKNQLGERVISAGQHTLVES